MKKPIFEIGQSVIAYNYTNSWGCSYDVFGDIVGFKESLTSGVRTYNLRVKYSETRFSEIEIDESDLEKINAKKEEGV